jgi:hypothetical protein
MPAHDPHLPSRKCARCGAASAARCARPREKDKAGAAHRDPQRTMRLIASPRRKKRGPISCNDTSGRMSLYPARFCTATHWQTCTQSVRGTSRPYSGRSKPSNPGTKRPRRNHCLRASDQLNLGETSRCCLSDPFERARSRSAMPSSYRPNA